MKGRNIWLTPKDAKVIKKLILGYPTDVVERIHCDDILEKLNKNFPELTPVPVEPKNP